MTKSVIDTKYSEDRRNQHERRHCNVEVDENKRVEDRRAVIIHCQCEKTAEITRLCALMNFIQYGPLTIHVHHGKPSYAVWEINGVKKRYKLNNQ